MQRNTLYALATLIVLAGASWWSLSAPRERGITRIDLSRVATDRMDTVELQRNDQHWIMRHQNGRWVLNNGHRADDNAVAELLRGVNKVVSSDELGDDPGRLQELGLAGPQAIEVTLVGPGQRPVHFLVGQPRGLTGYIAQGGRAFRVENFPYWAFARAQDAWEDKHVLDLGEHKLAQVMLEPTRKHSYTLVRHNDAWDLDEASKKAHPLRLDADRTQALAGQLEGLIFHARVEEDPGEKKTKLTAQKAAIVRWQLEGADQDDAPGELWIGGDAPEGGRYARLGAEGELFRVEPRQAEQLAAPVSQLRALNVMASLEADKIVAASITPPGGSPLRFEQQDGRWSVAKGTRAPRGYVLDDVRLMQRIRETLDVRGESLAIDTRKTSPSFGEIELVTADKQRVTLSFGPKKEASKDSPRLARGSADAASYWVSAERYNALTSGLDSLARAPAQQANAQGGGQGLDSLPPEVRRQLERKMAEAR